MPKRRAHVVGGLALLGLGGSGSVGVRQLGKKLSLSIKMIKLTRVLVFLFSALSFGCANQAANNEKISSDARQNATELSFREFYKSPVGKYGLEPTDKLMSLNGKRVHIQGHMVKEEQPFPGFFMLASLPVSIPEKEDGPSDDLPGSTLFVHMPGEDAQKTLAYRPGLWDLVGTLQFGPQEEANGRVSYLRLLLDQSSSLD